ncbi:hypothetical protein ABW21_db0202139 [Orbilia brochopaga]|nr:hypothetical protein ABW21_db0202139 [Drechslerella brochopaga]
MLAVMLRREVWAERRQVACELLSHSPDVLQQTDRIRRAFPGYRQPNAPGELDHAGVFASSPNTTSTSIAILDRHKQQQRPPAMGRYLPWRDGPGDVRPSKRLRFDHQDDAAAKRRQVDAEETFREDEYMRDGLAHDDRYIMVEDELLQIAKSYTAKLHSAEFARLQDQLRQRKAQKAAAAAASQPSQPKITASMSKQQQVVVKKRAHDAALQSAAGVKQDEAAHNPKFASRSLGRLMTSTSGPLDAVLPLPPLPGKGVKPATRAAAGFTKASFKKASSTQTSPSAMRRQVSYLVEDENEDETEDSGSEDGDEEEDLDAISKRRESTSTAPISRKSSVQDIHNRAVLSKQTPAASSRDLLHKSAAAKPAPRSPSSSPVSTRPSSRYSAAPSSKHPATPYTSTLTSKPAPSTTASKYKHRMNLADSDSDDYADPEQAARWRRRRELAENIQSGAKG